MRIMLHHDFNCPWCHIGVARLARVLDRYAGRATFETTYYPYPLVSGLPPGGVLQAERLVELAGSEDRAAAIRTRVTSAASSLELEIRYDRPLRCVDTTRAHRLVAMASPGGRLDLIRALYAALWRDAAILDDISTLAAIGAAQGVAPHAELERRLASTEALEQIAAAQRTSEAAPLITIPYLEIDGQFQVQAAHLPDVIQSCVAGLL